MIPISLNCVHDIGLSKSFSVVLSHLKENYISLLTQPIYPFQNDLPQVDSADVSFCCSLAGSRDDLKSSLRSHKYLSHAHTCSSLSNAHEYRRKQRCLWRVGHETHVPFCRRGAEDVRRPTGTHLATDTHWPGAASLEGRWNRQTARSGKERKRRRTCGMGGTLSEELQPPPLYCTVQTHAHTRAASASMDARSRRTSHF